MRLLRNSRIQPTSLWARCCMVHWGINSPVLDLTSPPVPVRWERGGNQISLIIWKEPGERCVRGIWLQSKRGQLNLVFGS